jgi:hypothetical protein
MSAAGLLATAGDGSPGVRRVAFLLTIGVFLAGISHFRRQLQAGPLRMPGRLRRLLSVSTNSTPSYHYEVCLSFAGEQRRYVDAVAEGLRARGVRIFYDRHEQVSLWGKDLHTHLDWVYRQSARYCVLFVSADYVKKPWTCLESSSAQSRATAVKVEYILPVRFDDTEIPGLHSAIGYLDLRGITPDELVQMIIQKVQHSHPGQASPTTVAQNNRSLRGHSGYPGNGGARRRECLATSR